jgi:hypothetical protein
MWIKSVSASECFRVYFYPQLPINLKYTIPTVDNQNVNFNEMGISIKKLSKYAFGRIVSNVGNLLHKTYPHYSCPLLLTTSF